LKKNHYLEGIRLATARSCALASAGPLDTGGGGGWTAGTQAAARACARGRDLGSGEGWRWGLGSREEWNKGTAAQGVEAAGVLARACRLGCGGWGGEVEYLRSGL